MQLAADRRCAAALAAGSSVTAHGAATDDVARCSASHDATARLSTATNVPPVIDDAGLPSVADGIPSTANVSLATDAARLSAAAYVPPAAHGHRLSSLGISNATAGLPNAASSVAASLSKQSSREGWKRDILLPKVPPAAYS